MVSVKHRTVKCEKVSGLIYRICVKSINEHESGMKQLIVPSNPHNAGMFTAHDSPSSGHS